MVMLNENVNLFKFIIGEVFQFNRLLLFSFVLNHHHSFKFLLKIIDLNSVALNDFFVVILLSLNFIFKIRNFLFKALNFLLFFVDVIFNLLFFLHEFEVEIVHYLIRRQIHYKLKCIRIRISSRNCKRCRCSTTRKNNKTKPCSISWRFKMTSNELKLKT